MFSLLKGISQKECPVESLLSSVSESFVEQHFFRETRFINILRYKDCNKTVKTRAGIIIKLTITEAV